MKPNEAADHEWIRQRKARQKNSTKDKKGYFSLKPPVPKSIAP